MLPSNPDVAYFDRLAPLFDWLHPDVDVEPLQRGLSYAERPVERVVDIGGGTGRVVGSLPVSEGIVVDASKGMLARSRRRKLPSVRGDAARMPLADDSVDAVLVVDALHHFHDPDGALAEFARILRPGGVAIVREFDRTMLRGRAIAAVEHLVGFDSTFFSPDELAGMVGDAGLETRVAERAFQYTIVGRKS